MYRFSSSSLLQVIFRCSSNNGRIASHRTSPSCWSQSIRGWVILNVLRSKMIVSILTKDLDSIRIFHRVEFAFSFCVYSCDAWQLAWGLHLQLFSYSSANQCTIDALDNGNSMIRRLCLEQHFDCNSCLQQERNDIELVKCTFGSQYDRIWNSLLTNWIHAEKSYSLACICR